MAEQPIPLLAIDDDRAFLGTLARILHPQFALHAVHGATEGLAAAATGRFDLVLLDLHLAYSNQGLEVLAEMHARSPELAVVMVTQETSPAAEATALDKGAVDFISKTSDIQAFERTLLRALDVQLLRRQNRYLHGEIGRLVGDMIGDSEAMRDLRRGILEAAVASGPVMIVGETGTGKELVARALHDKSGRKGLFVALNCAAIPAEIVESELFGSERGAFTGAERRITGSLETASHGTLFLDEITEMSTSLQAKLLRVIEERQYKPLGGSAIRPFHGRILASTNRDLGAAVRNGHLRQDLFYRLSAFVIRVPPLRERAEDIPELSNHFLHVAATDQKVAPRALTTTQLQELCAYPWPGNVRELKHTIETYVSSGQLVPAGRLLDETGTAENERELYALPYEDAKNEAVRRFQERYVRAAVAAHGGDISRAAEAIGLTRWGLQKILNQLEGRAEGREA